MKINENDKTALLHWLNNSARTSHRARELGDLAAQFGAEYCLIHGNRSVYIKGIETIAEAIGYTLKEDKYPDFTKISFMHEGVEFYGYEEERK